MAEALVAFGLASNIIQFVDSGMKLIYSTRELYQSAEGTLKKNAELREITSNIKLVAQKIANNTIRIDEVALREIAGICGELADELLAMLDGLKVDGQKNRHAEAFRKSLRSIRSRHKVKDIYDRLCKVRDQVCFHLNYLLNNRQASLLPVIHEYLDANKTLASETRNKLDAITSEIREIIRNKPWKQGDEDALTNLSTCVTSLMEQSQTARNTQELLKSLYFKQIKARQFEVRAAHTNTFEWIFEEDGSLNFVQWLQSSDDIFWIGGKAGSGKSTLMKFLCSHPHLSASLQKWAKQQRILIASHFFWSLGTSMQKSQEGLLRTLLFEILYHSPELIPILCPNRWNNDGTLDSFHTIHPWSLSELFQAFETLASIEQLPVRICLFIDGLDEYEGEHSSIIHIIKTLVKSPYIKLCVSSRPWLVFTDAFDGSHWKLYLQDLTRNDIRMYIKDNLEENSHFQQLKRQDFIGSENLVKQIFDKAQGVFLWVYLVVRSLLRGLTNGDDMSDLQRRLDKLPGHLEKYFKHILDTIEDIYQEQTARTFLIMANASATLPLIALHFMDKEKKDPNYAVCPESSLFQITDINLIMDTKRRQLNVRCMDLVEVTWDSGDHPFFKYKAGFLHRTVMDFLRTKDMETLICTRSGSDFNPSFSLCQAYLAQVKALPAFNGSLYFLATFRNLVLGTLYYARELEIDDKINAEILNELRDSVPLTNNHDKKGPCDGAWSWNMICPGGPRSNLRPRDHLASFLDVMVRCGLHLYVEFKVKGPVQMLEGTRLLCQALRQRITITKDYEFDSDWISEIDLSMLQLLLDLGISPSQIFVSHSESFFIAEAGSKTKNQAPCTVWEEFLMWRGGATAFQPNTWDRIRFDDIQARKYETPLTNAFEACEIMIRHSGANEKQQFLKSRGYLRKFFTDLEARRLEELLEDKSDLKPLPWWKKLWGNPA